MPKDEEKRGFMRTAASDASYNGASLALVIFGGIVFLAAAIAGLSVIGRLGAAGYIIYAFVLGTFALVFGPVIASAVTLRQKGSPRHRKELIARREVQLKKFGLHSRGFDPNDIQERKRRLRK